MKNSSTSGSTTLLALVAVIVLAVPILFITVLLSGGGGGDCDPGAGDITVDIPTDGSLSPGAKVKPMKQKDFQISSGFGPRGQEFHNGIDLAGPQGAPIYAAADGVVVAAGPASGFGHWIVLNHNINGHKWATVYGHMYAAGVLVKVGQRVTAGQHIADRGNDGQSTGAHLHFEVWDGGHRDFGGGRVIDPTGWVTTSPDPGSAAPRPAPTPNPGRPGPSDPSVVTAADWDKVAQLESGGNWAIDTGNGYQGGLQFAPSTWTGAGGAQYAPTANKATREQQMEVANRVLGTQGWGAWPSTSKAAGVTGKKPAPPGTFVNAARTPAPTPTPAPPATRAGDTGAGQMSGALPPLPASKGSEAHWQIDSIRLARAIAVKFPKIATIGGWRPSDPYPDHPSGRAIDVMIPNYSSAEGIALGNAVHKYVMDNKKFFKVVYTIWRQRYLDASGATNIMENRGSDTQNHMDHVHITLEGHGFPTGREVYTAPGVTGGGEDVDGGGGSEDECEDPAPSGGGEGHDNLAAGKVPPAYERWFRKAGTICKQISSSLLAGIGKQETGFQQNLTSPAGAKGPMQFMDYTFPSWAKDDDGNGRADPNDIGDAVMAAGRFSCANAAQIDAAIARDTVRPPAEGPEKLYAEAYNAGVGAILAAGGEPSGGDYDTQTRPYGANVIRYAREFAQQGMTTP